MSSKNLGIIFCEPVRHLKLLSPVKFGLTLTHFFKRTSLQQSDVVEVVWCSGAALLFQHPDDFK